MQSLAAFSPRKRQSRTVYIAVTVSAWLFTQPIHVSAFSTFKTCTSLNYRVILPHTVSPRRCTLPVLHAVSTNNQENQYTSPRPRHPNNKSSQTLARIRSFIIRSRNTLLKSSTHYHPFIQFLLLVIAYIFHLTVLTQHSIVFPFQLVPNDKGHFQSLGWDSLAGIMVSISYFCFSSKWITQSNNHTIFSPWTAVSCYSLQSPFTFPSPPVYTPPTTTNNNNNIINNNNNSTTPLFQWSLHDATKASSILVLFLLILAYFSTGRIASFFEQSLYSLAGLGFPLTIPMHRSLVVLFGHLSWVVMGSLLLSLGVVPQPFFQNKKNKISNTTTTTQTSSSSSSLSSSSSSMYKWYTQSIHSNWLWWTLGGYFVSSWFFNIADCINQYVLPKDVFELASEGVVAQLINPENNDLWASLVGYIAPCLSAPWWEEVLYRGFLLPVLCLFMNFWMAIGMSGILFSIHHLSATGYV